MYPSPRDAEPSVRDRVYRQATSGHDGRRSFAAVLLAVAVFLLVVSVSCRQVTEPGNARHLIEGGIASLTDIDRLLEDQADTLRLAAASSEADTLDIPGYPLDIVVTNQEVIQSSNTELRAIILERSSALVYAQGIDAFDRTGDQSIRRFSIQGLLEIGIGQLSESNHNRATLLAVVSLLATAALAAITAATSEGWGRMRSIGFAAAAGALPVILVVALLRLLVGSIGGDDAFLHDLRELAREALAVPLRNGLIVGAAGLVLVVAAIVLGRVERIVSPPPPEHIEDLDY